MPVFCVSSGLQSFYETSSFFILDTMALDHSNSSIWWDYKGGYNGIWCQRAFCWRWHLHCHGLNAWPAKMSRIRARDQNDIVSSYSPTRLSLYCHKANTYYHIADLHKKYSLIHIKRYLDGKLLCCLVYHFLSISTTTKAYGIYNNLHSRPKRMQTHGNWEFIGYH